MLAAWVGSKKKKDVINCSQSVCFNPPLPPGDFLLPLLIRNSVSICHWCHGKESGSITLWRKLRHHALKFRFYRRQTALSDQGLADASTFYMRLVVYHIQPNCSATLRSLCNEV